MSTLRATAATVWNRYWFAPGRQLDLEVVRIVVVATQVLCLLFRENYSTEQFQYLLSLPEELYRPLPILQLVLLGGDYQPTFGVLLTAKIVAIAAGVLALIGWRTRASIAVLAVATALLVAHNYSYGDFHHQEAPLVIALAVLVFAPIGRQLAVDSRVIDPDEWTAMSGWVPKLLQWQFVLIYLSAIMSKMVFRGGLQWLDGYTLQFYLARNNLREQGNELGLWLAQFHGVVQGLSYTVIMFQLTFVLAVLFPRLRWIYVPLGLAFHIGNWVLLQAPFPEWIALYSIFVPWSKIFASKKSWAPNPTTA